jgi:hypothetical protein
MSSAAARDTNNVLFACNWACCPHNRMTIRTTETRTAQRNRLRHWALFQTAHTPYLQPRS